MHMLTQGANATLTERDVRLSLTAAQGNLAADADFSLFVLGGDGRVRGDADMVFYNQPEGAGGAIRLDVSASTLTVALDRLDDSVQRIALCLVAGTQPLAALGTLSLRAGSLLRYDHPHAAEAGLILAELYRRGADWKLRAVGQGFAGGLAPLARHFGVDVAEDEAPPAPTPAPPPAVDLEKRLVSLAKNDARLVSLAKTAAVSLAKHKVERVTARVWLVLDVSGSMRASFRSGAVDTLVQRALAYGLNLDDDGRIGVVLFDHRAVLYGQVDAADYRGFADRVAVRKDLWGTTDYAKAMALLRKTLAEEKAPPHSPVYVIFVTDGGTEDRRAAEKELREASREPIFWKFVAIGPAPKPTGKKRRGLPRGFDFLEYLDNMPDRLIDNADFFSIEQPDALDDADFFDLMATEFGDWRAEAIAAGVLAPPP